ncbi:double glycine cleavage site bacteriolysin superfamily [Streptococcus pneumoniae]|nr:double glycine cleavage site bacteriolysin superfamily [Streptococcus pneumoniae]
MVFRFGVNNWGITIYYLIKKENHNMDKKQNLTSFQELTTTELNQITGGGWWEELLHETILSKFKITKALELPIQL